MWEELFKGDPNQHGNQHGIDRIMSVYAAAQLNDARLSENDPTDTLFVSLTAREVMLVGAGLTMIKAIQGPIRDLYGEDLNGLLLKIANSIAVQKNTRDGDDS